MVEVHRLRFSTTDDAVHSVEAEQQLLGAVLLNPRHISTIVALGGEALFFDPVHARIFAAAREKDAAGHLVSPVTVAAAMREEAGLAELGGVGYLARLAAAGAPHEAVRPFAEMLADLRVKRQMSQVLIEGQAAIARNEEPAAAIAQRIEGALLTLDMPQNSARPVSMAAALRKAVDMAQAAYLGDDDGSVPTGIASLDSLIGGFYPGELTLIAGRPSMGKTAVALAAALNAARAGHGVVIASLEMNPEAMALRALSEATAQAGQGIAYADIRRGTMTEPQWHHAVTQAKAVAKLPITFLPRSYADIGALLAGAQQAKRAMGNNMRLLIVDYAQLLRSTARTRYEAITEISIALKALAGSLNVPVVALSQLSRQVESRDDKRPMLSDLRESGQLEQDADCVIFCYRDEYYLERDRPGPDDPEALADWTAAMNAVRNRLELIVAKQRQGQIGTAHARFNPATNLVWEDRL
jgi:replicative DNA helicase